MNRRSLVSVTLLLVLVAGPLLAAGCSLAASGGKGTYKIGFIDSLTGYAAPLGVVEKPAEEMALEDLNGAGGVKGSTFEGIFYDDESSPPRAADLVRKLKEQNVIAIVGGTVSAVGQAASEASDREKVPFLGKSPLVLPLERGHAGNYVFGPPFENWDMSQELLLRLAVRSGGKRVAVIVSNDASGQTYDKNNRDILQKNPGLYELVGTEWMLTTDTDVTPQLMKLKALKPDVLLAGVSGRPATVVYKTIDLMDWKIPAVTLGANATTAFVDSVKGFSNRVLIASGPYSLKPGTIPQGDPSRVDDLTRFQRRLLEKTGLISLGGSVCGYENLFVVVDVLKKLNVSPNQDVQEVRDQVRGALETQEYQSILLPLKRSPQDHRGPGSWRLYMTRIEGNALVASSWIQYPGMDYHEIK